MDYKAIEELIKIVSDSKLTFFEIESDGIKIKMEKKQEQIAADKIRDAVKTIAVQEKEPILEEIKPVEEKTDESKKEGFIVTSPIVGTFYASSGPGVEPFVKVGSQVKKGDTLCIIEAMKLMNEIECETDGVIAEIFVQNEQMVEYGQPLFRII